MTDQPAVDATTFLGMGRDVFAKQPFSRFVGAELSALEPGRCGSEQLCAIAQGTIARLGNTPAA
jgi:hypothetical protein